MSELTPCNFCTLRRLRNRADRRGTQIVTRAATGFGGTDVFEIPKDHQGEPDRAKHFVAWMWGIPESCCC
jgi:hypothetical protein